MKLLLLLFALAACGPVPAVEYGEEVFHDPGLADSEFNAFACSTCHATSDDAAALPRIGRTLHDSAYRASWWGGYSGRLIDAASFCLVYFMRGQPIEPEDPRGRALYEYLVSLSPTRPAAALPLSLVENLAEVPRGSSGAGAEVWDRSCKGCHGEPHSGDDRISDLVPVVPETATEFAGELGVDPALVVIEKVRHGQFFGVGGNMPLFSREVMSDEELGALLAFLGL